jgi:hypothetical protein
MKSKSKRYMRNQLTGVLAVICGAWAICTQLLLGGGSTCMAANTIYDAALDEPPKDHLVVTNDVAIATRHLLWYLSGAGTAAIADATTPAAGTIDNIETSTGYAQKLLMLGRGHAKKMVASEAIAVNADVYQAAGGKVAGSGTIYLGKAVTASAADGDLLIVADGTPQLRAQTETVTATNVITASESGKTFFLSSATEFVSTLPAPLAGLVFDFIVAAAPSGASYTVVTNSSANILKGHVLSSDLNNAADSDFETSGGDTLSFVDGAAVAGDRARFISDGTNWYVTAMCSAQAGITITTAS